MGMALAIMLMFATFGSSSFVGVSAGMPQRCRDDAATVLGLLLLLGACGKSAQVPLQSWLLDAMEGPTPVSALIHAATMVTAGVYLVTRSNFVYDRPPTRAAPPWSSSAWSRCCAGASIGCAKDDIKKALAGSTMSQIGYMMLAAGIGPAGYAFAIFHLLTHGFFKANMFLGAGSVMHAMNDDVDMRHYGGLRRYMPITFVTFAMGYLAIIGFPGSVRLLVQGQDHRGGIRRTTCRRRLAPCSAPGSPAFYMTRLMLMTFFGEKRWAEGVHPHESPTVMTVPLMVLAALLGRSAACCCSNDWIVDWLAPVVGEPRRSTTRRSRPSAVTHRWRWSWSRVGVAVAWSMYGRRRCPRSHPPGVAVHQGRPAPTCTATPSTRPCSCAPASTSPGRWSSSTTGRRRGGERCAPR